MDLKIVQVWVASIGLFFHACQVAGSPYSFDAEPVYLGAVGHYAPLDYYPVAVAANGGTVWSLDLFHKEVQKLGSTGQVDQRFAVSERWPRDMEVDGAGNIYVADSAYNTIRKYDPNGNQLLQFGYSGDQPGEFKQLRAIVLDGAGNIYAADYATELSKFDPHGRLLWNTKAGVTPQGDLKAPQGIALDASGNIYVADTTLNEILIYSPTGTYLRKIPTVGTNWKLESPVGVAVAADGSIFVLNRLQLGDEIGLPQIVKFTNAGAFVDAWGRKGRGPGELWEPQGLTLDSNGDLVVAGFQGHNIVRYDQAGNFLGEFNDHNIQPNEFAQVRGAAVGKDGTLYVTDFWNQLVQVFDRYGTFLDMWGERGQGPGQYFNFPRFTAINDAGDIYVSDDRQVRRFTASGDFLAMSPYFTFPGGISIDSAGNVWVTGQGDDTIHELTPDLVDILELDGSAIPGGLNSPFGIAHDAGDRIYVADTMNHRILRLAPNGDFELAWGTEGYDPGQFRAPVGIAIDSEGHVFVSETWNERIQVFSPDGDYLTGWDVPGQPDKDVARVYELTMDGDYFLYAPDHTPGQAEVHKYALVPDVDPSGVPVYVAGQDLGYYLWSDDGAEWRVRWSGDGVLHDFSGTVTSTTPFVSSTAVGLDPDDAFTATSPNRVDFSASESDGDEGFDFLVGESGVVTFDLKIDGVASAGKVRVGSGNWVPNTLPLPLMTTAAAVSPIDTFGRPAYQPGVDGGVYVWQDAVDGEWHVRLNGDGVHTDNYTLAISTTGTFTGVTGIGLASNDALTSTQNTITYTGFVGAWQDGIDFFAQDGDVISFTLTRNGAPAGNSIVVGRTNQQPGTGTVPLVSAPAIGVVPSPIENVATVGAPNYVPAQDAGYYLWQDEDDGEWHVRWSGDSVKTFTYAGTIATSQPFTSVSTFSFESNDSLQVDTSTVSFTARAGAGQDGLDFFVPEGTQVTFSLFVDEQAVASEVEIGNAAVHPTDSTFTLLSASLSTNPDGQPSSYNPAVTSGYFIWRDVSDGKWHLRWSGDSITTFHYEGSVKSSSGFSNWAGYSFESNDTVNLVGDTLTFTALAGAGDDGLDFTVPAGSQLIFDLQSQYADNPATIAIGTANAHPATIPFSLPAP